MEHCNGAVGWIKKMLCPEPECNGRGLISSVVPGCCRNPHTNGECCGDPVAVEVQEPCQWCCERAELVEALKSEEKKANQDTVLYGNGFLLGGKHIPTEQVRLSEGFIDVVFDEPPGPNSCRFIEVEDSNGHSISYGAWVDRPDGLYALRIPIARRKGGG